MSEYWGKTVRALVLLSRIAAKHLLANVAFEERDLSEVRAIHEQVLAESRRIGYQAAIVSTLIGLGSVAALEGSYDLARRHLQESIRITRQIGLVAYEEGAQKKLEWISDLQNDKTVEPTAFEQVVVEKRQRLPAAANQAFECKETESRVG